MFVQGIIHTWVQVQGCSHRRGWINWLPCFQIHMNTPPQHTGTFLWWIYLGHWLMARTDAQLRFNPVFVCVRVRVKERKLVIVTVHLSAMLSPAVCDSSREPEPKEHPTGIKKALSTGCVSQWAAEPRGAALLIKARAVCQWRHMMHGAINVGVKTKREAKCCNKSAASPWNWDILLQQWLLWLRVSVSVCTVT